MPVQGVDEHPGLDVLAPGLFQPQLLGPLDVVALVGHVDAGPRDLQRVHDLDGLELDEAAAAEPGGHDVLGELGVGAGAGADGRGEVAAGRGCRGEEVRHGVGRVGPRPVEEPAGDAEDGPAVAELAQGPIEKLVKGQGTHGAGHGRPPGTDMDGQGRTGTRQRTDRDGRTDADRDGQGRTHGRATDGHGRTTDEHGRTRRTRTRTDRDGQGRTRTDEQDGQGRTRTDTDRARTTRTDGHGRTGTDVVRLALWSVWVVAHRHRILPQFTQ